MNCNTPLRVLDVPEPDGTPPLDEWAILSQYQPLVLAHADSADLNAWSGCRSDALLMPWPVALRCAQRLLADGEPVVLVRGNAENWKWLFLVTEWPGQAQLDN